MIKILFTLTPAFNPNAGGVQRTTWKMGKYFVGQGHSVAYYSLDHQGHTASEFGSLFYAPEPGKTSNQNNIQDLEKVLHDFNPDIVINQMPYVRELRDVLAKNRDRMGYVLIGCLRNSLFNFRSNARDHMQRMLPPLVYSMLNNPIGINIIQYRHKLRHSRDLRAILDGHDHFVLLAPPNRKELQFFVGDYRAEKVDAIPNSIPEVVPELPQKEKIILHVGRLGITQKRSDLLIPFWEKLHKRLPDWNFVVVGDGSYMNTLRDEIKNKNLPRMELKGFQKPEPYYAKASVFMMPSAFEGFPNTLIEAQSYGCAPVLFNSFNALDWVVKDGSNAVLVSPFDTSILAERTFSICDSQEQLKAMQQASLLNAERFTIERVGRQWTEFFKEIKYE